MPLRRFQKQFFSIHQDSSTNAIAEPVADVPLLSPKPIAPLALAANTLEPTTTSNINSMQGPTNTIPKHVLGRTATIRSVPSFEGSESSPDSKHNSSFSNSTNSKLSGLTAGGHGSPIERTPSPGIKPISDTMAETPTKSSAGGLRATEQPNSSPSPTPLDMAEDLDNGQWDSTIGKAGLGKTGRVINKLVSDNDALKREIKIEKLRAEEAKLAAKLLEDKMERMVSDYESRLLEANVTKTLLSRKERQVEALSASVELEKKKTLAAQELERNWKDEMGKIKRDTKSQVDDATSYAQLMEGRYNAISSHWQNQGDEVDKAVKTIKAEINDIIEERKGDDDKIQTLRDLCEQQDSNIKELKREKEEIARLFEEYKQTQENDLRDIKLNAQRTEAEQERLLEESRETLDKLRWALNVKKNVKDAE